MCVTTYQPPTAIGKLRSELRETDLDFAAFLEWLRTVPMREAPPAFVPQEPCRCPVATYLRERFKVDDRFESESSPEPLAIEVGDDDISVEGYFAVRMRDDWRGFVSWFDGRFKDAKYQPVAASEVVKALPDVYR